MYDAEIVDLGATEQDPSTGVPLHQAKGPPVSDDGDAPDYGKVPNFSALGVTAIPYPTDDNGNAQGVVVKVPGIDGVLVGARDTRTANVVGKMRPGDTALHSTGPEQAAQVHCKEETRTVVAATKGSDGKSIVLVLDGKNDKIQLTAKGAVIEISEKQTVITSPGGGASIMLTSGGQIVLNGTIMLGGVAPKGPIAVMVGGSPAPAPGVFA